MKKSSTPLLALPFKVSPPPPRSIGINIIFVLLILCTPLVTWAQGNNHFVRSNNHYIGGYHIKCNGSHTGQMEATPLFGTAPYTYLWNTSETSQELINKPAGIYIVTATDANNISRTDTFELRQPYPLNHQSTLSDYSGFNISSHGGSNGEINISPTGGTPPYRYLWNNGDSISHPRNLTAGNYSFTITDANQCTHSANITLTQPNNLQVSFTNVVNPTCNKNYDGKATIEITGGLGDFSVVWDNGSFSLSPDDLPTGYNAVRIYEHGTAILDTGITLTEPDMIDIQFTYSQYNNFNVSCVDCFNGTITSTVSGGTAPYTYQWEDANNSTTANLSNLNGGDYPLFVTDAHGCRADNIAQLTMPTPKDWSRSGNANIDTSEFIGSTDTSALRFKTNNQEVLRLNGNGNVGIGLASPTEKLEVNGNIKAKGAILFGNGASISKLDSANGGVQGLRFDRDEVTAGPTGEIVMIPSCFSNLYSTYNIFQGFLRLSVPNTADVAAAYFGNDGTGGVIESSSDGETNMSVPVRLKLNTYCGMDVVVGQPTAGSLIANYRVGIGTSNPIEKLHVEGKTWLNGSVHIGDNANPVSLLAVEGKVFAREFHVNEANNWPDYVFDKNYALLPIPALKEYLLKNRHLPGMPAAKEVEKEGYDLSATVKTLTKQVEELHLYIIQLKEEIDSLKK